MATVLIVSTPRRAMSQKEPMTRCLWTAIIFLATRQYRTTNTTQLHVLKKLERSPEGFGSVRCAFRQDPQFQYNKGLWRGFQLSYANQTSTAVVRMLQVGSTFSFDGRDLLPGNHGDQITAQLAFHAPARPALEQGVDCVHASDWASIGQIS